MKKRIITGVVSALLLIGVLYINGIVLELVILYAMLFAGYEIFNAFRINWNTLRGLTLLTTGLALFICVRFWDIKMLCPVLFLAVLAVMIEETVAEQPAWDKWLGSLFTLAVYIPFIFLYELALQRVGNENGMLLFIAALVISFAGDIAAYFVGSFLGKHKMCPDISPKKTWEGACGSIAGSLISAVVLSFFGKTIPIWQWLLLGLIGNVAAQMGDLYASIIKRHNGIKDFGKIFPGHGGVMDRLDGALFCGIVMYLYGILMIC